jgi:hypothetical protein
MAKKKKAKDRNSRRASDPQWQQENESLQEFRRKAPHIKALLKMRGCVLPFFDYLDSYPDEFKRVADKAIAEHPTLVAVHEVDDKVFEKPENHWEELGYGHLKQVFFTIGDEFADYGKRSLDANLAGHTTAFLDREGDIHTVIIMKQSIRTSFRHGHLKYALKIASLCHEIGHVEDIEKRTNFKFDPPTLDIIEAEAYAHLYALEMLAKRGLRMSYTMLADGLREAAGKEGYLGQVATAVAERMPECTFMDWQSLFSAPTPDEAKRLGPRAMRELSA